MRISLTILPLENKLTLPIHYNHIIQSLIYSNLGKKMAKHFHDGGYALGKRIYKLFTFSRLMAKQKVVDQRKKTITFKGPVTIKIGSVNDEFLESLVTNLVRKGSVTILGKVCSVLSIEVEMPYEPSGPVLVKAISPITTYTTFFGPDGRKKTHFYRPEEEGFCKKILENLERKGKAYFEGKLPELNGAYIRPVKVTEKDFAMVNFKGFWIKGWTGLYELYLPEPYFELAYNAGLGSKNSQGFGMVEVVDRSGTKNTDN